MVFLDYYRTQIAEAYRDQGFAICVSKMGRREEQLVAGNCVPGTLPTASRVILRTEGRMDTAYRGDFSPEGRSDLSRVTETQGKDPRPQSFVLLQ